MKIKAYHYSRGSWNTPDEKWEIYIEDDEVIRILRRLIGGER